MKITDVDVHILNELKKDARLSMRELSKRVNLSAPAVAERVRKLEDAGVIEGYSVQVNYKKLGLMIDCLLEVTVLNGEYQRFVAFMNQHPRAFFAYRVAGQSCFFIKLSVASLEEIEAFIQAVSGFTKTVSHIVLSEHSFSHPIQERVKQIEEPEMTVMK
ncbi:MULTISPECIES: Lrp/AsnC family transcriptional regulator [Bacillus]|uniref:Lrp/AsnC family transcriptional regulator n=1 Tax=Bacillus TaxID=1386 RepID=UPI000717767C|nr:Lrp/AsnC family transcriptional regulator [Bacillus pumilus]AMM99058.1 AsnC family transcriptional regulator [Bacillus pumilus]KRU17674.1 AsnC family transcriptional regulator [Bacillus pumilus]MCY7678716.1 Lrp/AsnC family transcriptional regulator [Bacillus pumilus]MCY9672514.1 Lrp/AsnC family transcriptional regulator [Bacillus pumilus]MDH3149523.1 Lrp/AsnC family transcriptional regulator [Bacillus pumilus]